MTGAAGNDMSKDSLRVQKYVAALGVSLMAIKFIAWMMTDSVSILTDAMESIVNVVAALIGLYALYLSSRPRDADYPFGHGKVELISSSLEGVMIIFAGVTIILQAISRFISPEPIHSLDLGLLIIAITAVANYTAGRFAIMKGRSNRSVALVASGKHLCSDTYSSVGIILGLSLMMVLGHFGLDVWWLDPLIASVFGLIIMVTGMKVVKESMDGVMDRIDEQTIQRAISIINSKRHDHWIDIHNLRVIKYGPTLHIELHIVLPMQMTMTEQGKEFTELKDAIIEEFGEQVDLIVMGESCGHCMCAHCKSVCENRSEPFASLIEWDIDTMTDETEDHSEQHFGS